MTDEFNLTEEQILEWLAAHPEVLQQASFLRRLPLSDTQSGAASLLNRQNQVLREENETLTRQYNELVSVAQENERLFHRTRELILAIISATTIEELAVTLRQQFKQHFKASAVELLLYADDLPAGSYRCIEPAALNPDMQAMLAKNPINCGTFRPHEMAELFGDETLGSAALIQLGNAPAQGILAVGNTNPLHFHNALDTLFIEHIGAAISRRLAQLLPVQEEVPAAMQQAAQ